MHPYIITCCGKLFGTNADNLMDAEMRFIEEYPQYQDEIILVNEGTKERTLDGVQIF